MFQHIHDYSDKKQNITNRETIRQLGSMFEFVPSFFTVDNAFHVSFLN